MTLKEDRCVRNTYALPNDQYGPVGGTQYYITTKDRKRSRKTLNCGVHKPIINFTDGQLNLGAKNILAISEDDLNTLAEEGLLRNEKTLAGLITTSKMRRKVLGLGLSSPCERTGLIGSYGAG